MYVLILLRLATLRRSRVLMIPSVLIADQTCRTPQYDRRLGEAVQAAGFGVDMWAAGCYTDELYNSNLPVTGPIDIAAHLPGVGEQLKKRLKAGEYLANLVALWWHLNRHPQEVLHVQWLPLLDVMSLELSVVRRIQRRGTRVVYTVHDVLPLDAEGHAVESSRRRFTSLYQQVDGLICHTNTSRERLIDEFGIEPSKVWHIPHGPLDPLENASASTGEEAVSGHRIAGIPKQVPAVVLFGVLRPYKGYEFLLNAWPQVIESVEEARLVIAGRADREVRQQIDTLAEETGVPDSISRIYRYLEDQELKAIIQSADVLVYPYRNITQSGALFTGMGAGKAIVATRVGGLSETLQDRITGSLVDYGDRAGLASALVDLLNDPGRRRSYGENVYRDLQTRLSWEQIAEKTIECYRATAQRSANVPS